MRFSPVIALLRFALGCASLCCLVSSVRAEKWALPSGQTIDGKLSNVVGPFALITNAKGSMLCRLDELTDADLLRVDSFLASRPAQAPAWKTSESPVAKSLRNRLQILLEGKLVAFDPGDRPEPELYVVYFSAHWCPPCRRFTPRLVETYKELHALPANAAAFELIFVSSDEDSSKQEKYVQEVSMPWPFVKYSQLGRVTPIERWAGPGIPCLAVLDRDGNVLFHSYHGSEYVGPDDTLSHLATLLPLLNPNNLDTKRARHRLAVLEQVRAGKAGDVQPRPYFIALTRDRYPKSAIAPFKAAMTVTPNGQISYVEPVGNVPSEIAWQFKRDAEKWLFLPAVKGGAPVSTRVVVPVQF